MTFDQLEREEMENRPTPQRTIIAGSRSVLQLVCPDGTDPIVLLEKLRVRVINQIDYLIKRNRIGVSEVVSGCAAGVDTFGEYWAGLNDIRVVRFPAEWNRYGRGAGFRRNYTMAEYAAGCPSGKGGQLIALWDGKSRGTKHMIEIAEKSGLKVVVGDV